MNNESIIRIEGIEFWGRYIFLTAASGHALLKIFFDEKLPNGTCEIGELNTHPQKQRQGYATLLLQTAENIAKEKGCDVIQLWTKKGTWVQEWYERMGYIVQDFMTPPSNDTLWLKKFLR